MGKLCGLNVRFTLPFQPIDATFYSLTIERRMLTMKQRPRIYYTECQKAEVAKAIDANQVDAEILWASWC